MTFQNSGNRVLKIALCSSASIDSQYPIKLTHINKQLPIEIILERSPRFSFANFPIISSIGSFFSMMRVQFNHVNNFISHFKSFLLERLCIYVFKIETSCLVTLASQKYKRPKKGRFKLLLSGILFMI